MSEDIHDTAARWHVAQVRDDMDWDGFTMWLESDPRHRVAFDEIALLDDRIDVHRSTLRTLLADEVPTIAPARRRHIGRWAVAAAAIMGIGVTVAVSEWRSGDAAATAIAYRAGASGRDLTLGPGLHASLGPGSELVAQSTAPILLSLSGRAVFDIAHDPSRTVVVRAQGYEIRDVGTRFEVVSDAGLVNVAVAEGRVGVRTSEKAAETVVAAGQSLTGRSDGGITMGVAEREAVGRRRGAPIIYNRLPLGLVVADIARSTGRPTVADPAVAQRPFSGVLAPGDRDAMVRSLVTLADIEARRDGDTIRLGARAAR